jgi:SpoVK/Ycf46/Vps4 family AAA+-type ATPase
MALPNPVDALRDAVRLSPENAPLRQALAEALAGLGRYDEAEREYKSALALAPNNQHLKLGLAAIYFQQDKNSHALVIVEDLIKNNPPAAARVLHAKLLLRAGDTDQAVRQYKRAVEQDPDAADESFAARLGISPDARDSDEVIEGKIRASASASDDPDADAVAKIERPKIDFNHVGGMDAVKEEIQLKIIHPLAHPELYKAYGKTAGGGILLYGPPGCGKTYLARATAGQIKAAFLAVGINDILNMWLGNSEKNLHELFEQARRNRPCVLFFDEVDALAASRADMRTSAGRHLINQFLAELDGVSASNEGVLILAATNAPWHVDPAFRRPGRFDRILFVPPPDAPARANILRIQLKGKPLDQIDYDHLAKKTEGFSGADLKGAIDIAIENKLRQAIKEGTPKPITTKDLLTAASSTKPTTKEWFATARNYALYSNQGGAYDDILKYLKL